MRFEALNRARAKIDFFGTGVSEGQERWKDDHDVAMACLDFEHTLAAGIRIYEYLGALDIAITDAAIAGEIEDVAGERAKLIEVYRLWCEPSQKALAIIAHYETQGHAVDGTHKFQEQVVEAMSLLSDTVWSFDHDKLAELRDEAIDQARQGLTEPL